MDPGLVRLDWPSEDAESEGGDVETANGAPISRTPEPDHEVRLDPAATKPAATSETDEGPSAERRRIQAIGTFNGHSLDSPTSMPFAAGTQRTVKVTPRRHRST